MTILLGGVLIFEGCSEDYLYLFFFLLFRYKMGLVTIINIHCTYFLYMLMYVSFTYPYMCCFFSFFMYILLIICMQSIISVLHKDTLMCFV